VFGIDSSYLKNRLSAYKAELENYIKSNEINPADLVEKTVIVPANRPELAAGLPYELVARTDMVDEIGAHLTHQLTIKFYQSQSAQNLDNPTLSYTLPLPAIGTQRLSVTYVPATEADAEALEQFINSDATELPLYLFNVKPQLQLDGTVLAEGTAIGMGLPQYYTLTLSNPHDSYSANGTATAGDEIVFGVNGSGMTPELVQKRLDAVPSDTAAENMHQAGLHFWMEHDLFDKMAAQAFSVHVQRMPSVGSFSIPLSVSYFFGIPRSGNYRSRQVDVKLNLQIVVAPTDTARFNFMSQIGMHGSYLEGSVLDQLFGLQRQPGISAAQLLMEANDQGIPIYTITADNVNSIRPILNVGEDVQLDITNAIHAGKQVIVPQRELVHGNWVGAGYIIQDPVTGEGVYLLSGGLNGGGHETCEISLAHSVHPMSPISQAVQEMINEAFTVFLASHFRLVEALLSEEIDHTEYYDALQMAVRTLAAKVAELATETAVGGSGCFVAEAYGLPKQIALPLFYNWEGERQTDVDLSVAEFAHCRDHAWQIRQHLEDETSTVIGTSDQAALTYPFSEEGQYTAEVSAICQEMGSDRVESSVDITIHDLIATVEFCDAATEGNPVHPATGATVEQQTLLSVQGLLPIEFRLQYHSLRLGLGSTGRGWEVSVFGASLREQSNGNVRIHWSNNHYNDFNKQADGSYKSPQSDCVFDKLLKNPDGSFTVTRNNQTVYQFSAAGQLVKIGNRRGQFLELAYNSAGQVAKVTEPVSGVFLQYHYEQGLLVRVSDPLGRQATLAYDEHHNLVSMTDGAGQTTTLTYNNKGQLLTKTNADRLVVSSNRYDERGRVISQEDANSRNEPLRLSYQSNKLGYLTTTVTGRLGQKRLYVHDQEYNLLSFTDELGYKTRYSYNDQGQRTRITDALERTTAMAYDSHGNLASFSDAAGNVTAFVYDEKQNLVEATNALGQSIHFGYDSNNNLTRITDADSNVTRISYNAQAQVQTVTQPRGGVTRYYYTLHTTDPTDVTCQNGVPVTAPIAGGVSCTSARPVLVVSAEGTRRKLAYDQAGRLVRITDGDNHSVTLTYDGINRLLSVINPLGHTVSVTYLSRNNLTTRTDANGNISRWFYDANGNLVAYINTLTQGTRYDYDGEDRLIRVVDATNRATQLSYDAKNRLVSLTNPLGQTQTLEYDAVDNLIKRVDAVGQSVISLSYNNRDNLTHVSDALGNTTAFHYDVLSRLIQTTEPLNRVTQFRYDNHNRLVESLDAFLGRSTQQFDADGHRQKLSDAKNNALQFEFDFNSRLVQETDATANQVSYTYNARDLLAKITNGRGQQRDIEYDAAGRITRWTDPDGSVSYTYDANGNVLTVTDSQGTITREYDPLNRVTKYTDTQANTLQYAYNEVGNLVTLTYPDGRQVHYEYDAANRLVKVTDWAARVTTYEYDQNGRVISTLRPNGTQQSRVYDKAGQLLQLKDIVIATGDVISQFDFRYDAAGNITQELVSPPPERFQFTTPVNMTYTAANRLATYNGEAVQFDADGNMTKGPLSGGGLANFVFDSRNRLVAAGKTAYRYDAENQRTAVSIDGQETRYVINSVPVLSQVLVRTQPDGTQTYYVHGLGLIGQEKQGQYLSYHFDFRGSTVALTDETGQVVELFQYSPYGFLLRGEASITPFLFNGRYGVMTDGNELYYMRARYYHPEIRRFVNQDILLGAIFDGQTLNRYAYVTGRPVSYIDPFGLAQMDLDRAIDIVRTLIPEIYTEEGDPEFCSLPLDGTKQDMGYTDPFTGKIKIHDALEDKLRMTMEELDIIEKAIGVQQRHSSEKNMNKRMFVLLSTVIHEYMHSRDIRESIHPVSLIFWSLWDAILGGLKLPNNHAGIYRDSKFLAKKYLHFLKMSDEEWQEFKRFYNACYQGCTTR
jgi:RHS repeat-associated protein